MDRGKDRTRRRLRPVLAGTTRHPEQSVTVATRSRDDTGRAVLTLPAFGNSRKK